jgi:hypothetical protein
MRIASVCPRPGASRWADDPVSGAPQFPYWLMCGVLPAALLTSAGIFPLWCGLLLLGQVGAALAGAPEPRPVGPPSLRRR